MGSGFWVKGDGIIGMCGGDNKFLKESVYIRPGFKKRGHGGRFINAS